MSEYCVYMHINKANGKRYVGITSVNPLQRWANGNGYYRNKHFHDAIIKYGWDNFTHLILYTGLSKDEACEVEKYLIKYYKTQDKEKGYNLTSGGEHFSHSEESKKIISERRRGKGRTKRTQEQIQKMKANHGGGALPSAVICLDTGETYKSINDASRATGINKKGISGCCRGIRNYNTAGGMRWAFAEGNNGII